MSISKSLKTNYKKYQKGKNGQKETLGFLHSFMPEMIFRTTKLETRDQSSTGEIT